MLGSNPRPDQRGRECPRSLVRSADGRVVEVRGIAVTGVALRLIEDSDLDALFEQMRDPEAVRMAAFTAKDPDDREAFVRHMAKLRTSPDITTRAATKDGQLAGSTRGL